MFLSERLTAPQIALMPFVAAGIFLCSDFLRPKFDVSVGLALVTMLVWGIFFTFIKVPIRQVGWFWPNYLIFALFPLLWLFMKWRGDSA